jgi:hypothetical protein
MWVKIARSQGSFGIDIRSIVCHMFRRSLAPAQRERRLVGVIEIWHKEMMAKAAAERLFRARFAEQAENRNESGMDGVNLHANPPFLKG